MLVGKIGKKNIYLNNKMNEEYKQPDGVSSEAKRESKWTKVIGCREYVLVPVSLLYFTHHTVNATFAAGDCHANKQESIFQLFDGFSVASM